MSENVLTLPKPATSRRPQWSREARRLFIVARNARGWTQEATARWLGVGQRTVQRWESGQRQVYGWALVAMQSEAVERAERMAA